MQQKQRFIEENVLNKNQELSYLKIFNGDIHFCFIYPFIIPYYYAIYIFIFLHITGLPTKDATSETT